MNTEALQFLFQPEATMISSTRAHQCRDCGEMRYLWVNRSGRTTCYACDEQRHPGQAALPRPLLAFGGAR